MKKPNLRQQIKTITRIMGDCEINLSVRHGYYFISEARKKGKNDDDFDDTDEPDRELPPPRVQHMSYIY